MKKLYLILLCASQINASAAKKPILKLSPLPVSAAAASNATSTTVSKQEFDSLKQKFGTLQGQFAQLIGQMHQQSTTIASNATVTQQHLNHLYQRSAVLEAAVAILQAQQSDTAAYIMANEQYKAHAEKRLAELEAHSAAHAVELNFYREQDYAQYQYAQYSSAPQSAAASTSNANIAASSSSSAQVATYSAQVPVYYLPHNPIYYQAAHTRAVVCYSPTTTDYKSTNK